MGKVPSELASASVQDENGVARPLADAWRERPAVLAFVRHFGWLFCRELVAQLRGAEERIEAAGARLVVVGNGAPAFVAPFRAATGFLGPILVDPSLAAYRALGLPRTARALLDPRALVAAARALRRGHRQGRVQGDAWQQGGVAVVRPPDELLYLYVSRYSGDHPDPSEVVSAVANAGRAV